jgi:SH3-like domain-containing protein
VIARGLLLFAALLAVDMAQALDFRSVVEPALLYDAPSQQASPVFAIARGTPVEAVVILDAWVKVRDAKGNLAWIEKRLLGDKRTVMVAEGRVSVLAQPDEKAATVFQADRDVLVEVVEAAPVGWVKVRHRDGQQGYLKAAQVWGL